MAMIHKEEIPMKRTICLLFALLLTGCGATVPEEEVTPAPPTASEETMESPMPEEPVLPENAAKGTVVEFAKELPATVDRNHTLTLRFRCRAIANGYGTWDYGVNAIEVQEGEALLQTLSIPEAMETAVLQRWEQWAAEGDQNYQELLTQGEQPDLDYTEGWTCDGRGFSIPEIGDLNFDGSDDIRLAWEDFITANTSYLHWLWDPETGQFQYAFTLYGYGFQIDEGERQLVASSNFGGVVYNTDYYAYDENGILYHVKNVRTEYYYTENPKDDYCITTVHEWVNGIWTQTEQTTSKM